MKNATKLVFVSLLLQSIATAVVAQTGYVVVAGKGATSSLGYNVLSATTPPQPFFVSESRADGPSSSFASMSFLTGSLRASAVSGFGPSTIYARSLAFLQDSISITGSLPFPAFGELRLSVTGLISGNFVPPSDLGINANAGAASATLAAGNLALGPLIESTQSFVGNSCFGVTGACSMGVAFSQTLIVPFTVTAANRNILITANLGTIAYNGAIVNFANTANLSITLPSGLGFTSNTGLLSAVPEPTSAAIMSCGLTLLVGVVWRRRRLSYSRVRPK